VFKYPAIKLYSNALFQLVTAVEHKSVEQHRTYQDKFESQGLSPTFRQFGGTHLDGIMFITSLGRAVTLTLPLDLVNGEVLAENLHPLASCRALDEKRVDWTCLKSELGHTDGSTCIVTLFTFFS
jgi:hypothetical protein